MAGVFEPLFRPQNKAVHLDLKAMELEAAKEILAEVFKVRLSEVDEMIQGRFEAACCEDIGSKKEDGLWPQEFWLEG
jgi:predicted enzyme related to lactoylglutathione lyase